MCDLQLLMGQAAVDVAPSLCVKELLAAHMTAAYMTIVTVALLCCLRSGSQLAVPLHSDLLPLQLLLRWVMGMQWH